MKTHLGGCQKYGPFLGTLNIRCRTIIGTQKGTIILTSTHFKKRKDRGSVLPSPGLASRSCASPQEPTSIS